MAIGLTVVLGIWLTGFAVGYGLRHYVSYRRHHRAHWPTAFDHRAQ